MISHALQYAGERLPVFPTHWMTPNGCSCGRDCSSPGKHPLTRHGLKDASYEAGVIYEWWQHDPFANIAIATGLVYVVDLDGAAGIALWDALSIKHDYETVTRTARTGGGGRHLYYRMPHGEELPNTAGKLGKKIDTRGYGGYVLAPPSNHISGNSYEWLNTEPVADLPVWVIETLRPKLPKQPPAPPTLATGGTAYGEGVLMGALRRISSAPEGERNQRLNYEAFLVAQYISGGEVDRNGVLEALTAASPDPDTKKSHDTVRRAMQEGAQYPRRKQDD